MAAKKAPELRFLISSNMEPLTLFPFLNKVVITIANILVSECSGGSSTASMIDQAGSMGLDERAV